MKRLRVTPTTRPMTNQVMTLQYLLSLRRIKKPRPFLIFSGAADQGKNKEVTIFPTSSQGVQQDQVRQWKLVGIFLPFGGEHRATLLHVTPIPPDHTTTHTRPTPDLTAATRRKPHNHRDMMTTDTARRVATPTWPGQGEDPSDCRHYRR